LLQRPGGAKNKEVTDPEAEVGGSGDFSDVVGAEPKVPIEQHDHIGNGDESSIEDESGMSDHLMDKTSLENDRPPLERAPHGISTTNPQVKNSREIETVRSERHAGEEIQGAGW
jgi:hypothetical protein